MYEPKHLKRWQHPSNYIGETWPDYYVFLGRHRDSDVLTNSNFEVALQTLADLPTFDDDSSRSAIREGHWAVGWVEWIAIHADDEDALMAADSIMESLDSYPVLDEDAFSEAEQREADEVWANCYTQRERVDYVRKYRSQFGFRGLADLLACVRGRYFAGVASELIA